MACAGTQVNKDMRRDKCEVFVPGTKEIMAILNFEDYTVVYSADFPDVVASITNKLGKVGYKYEGQNNSMLAKSSFAPTTFSGAFTHTNEFTAWSLKPEDLEQINILSKGRVIVVWKDKNGKIWASGINAGMKLTASEMDSSNADYGTCRRLTLVGAEEKKEVALFGTYTLAAYITDAGATIAIAATGYVKTSAYNEVASLLAFENLFVVGV